MSEFSFLIVFGSSIAMASVFLALMPGISRIYVAMARDGILPRALSTIHKKFNSAYISEVNSFYYSSYWDISTKCNRFYKTKFVFYS
jgi:amino acid transporter